MIVTNDDRVNEKIESNVTFAAYMALNGILNEVNDVISISNMTIQIIDQYSDDSDEWRMADTSFFEQVIESLITILSNENTQRVLTLITDEYPDVTCDPVGTIKNAVHDLKFIRSNVNDYTENPDKYGMVYLKDAIDRTIKTNSILADMILVDILPALLCNPAHSRRMYNIVWAGFGVISAFTIMISGATIGGAITLLLKLIEVI